MLRGMADASCGARAKPVTARMDPTSNFFIIVHLLKLKLPTINRHESFHTKKLLNQR